MMLTCLVWTVIEDAERQGLLHPHTSSRIFEGTVGSTGISIATIARARQVSSSSAFLATWITVLQRLQRE